MKGNKMQGSRWIPAVEELGALTNFVGVLACSKFRLFSTILERFECEVCDCAA